MMGDQQQKQDDLNLAMQLSASVAQAQPPSPCDEHQTESSTSSEDSQSSTPSTIFLERPKRALTAYNIFFQAQRQRMLEEQKVSGKKVGFAGMARTVAAMWKAIDPSEKVYYEALATQDRARHAHELTMWKKAKKASTGGASSSKPKKSSKKKAKKANPAREPQAIGASPAFAQPEQPQFVVPNNAMVQQGRHNPQLAEAMRVMMSQDSNLASPEVSHSSLPESVAQNSSMLASQHAGALFSPAVAFGATAADGFMTTASLDMDQKAPAKKAPRSAAAFETDGADAFDLEPIQGPGGDPSLPALADRMGSPCVDLFLDMFRQ